MAVERNIGRIQVEHDLVRHRGVRLDEQIAQQRVDLLRRVMDFVIAPGTAAMGRPLPRRETGLFSARKCDANEKTS